MLLAQGALNELGCDLFRRLGNTRGPGRARQLRQDGQTFAQIARFHRIGASLSGHDRGVAQHAGHRFTIQRRGHDQHPKVGSQIIAPIEGQGEAEISLQATLVKLVKDDKSDPLERRVVLQHAGQDAFGNHFDAGVIRDASIHSHPIAHSAPNTFIQCPRHALRNSASGQPTRLQHQHAPTAHPRLIQQNKRQHSTLARTGRRLKNNRRGNPKCV